MRCQNCGDNSSRIIQLADGTERCHHCGDFSEAAGPRTTGLLTRNSFRIRSEAVKNEGDTIQPFIYNKTERKMDMNPDFIKLYPDQAKDFYLPEETDKKGLKKLTAHSKALKAQAKEHKEKLATSVEFEGDAKAGIKKIVGKDGKK
jgi:hypothetical protein